jgi:hypothetical protein
MSSPAIHTDKIDLRSGSYREKSQRLAASSSTDTPQAEPFDEVATKRLLRKIDWHLIPFAALIYLSVSFVFHILHNY